MIKRLFSILFTLSVLSFFSGGSLLGASETKEHQEEKGDHHQKKERERRHKAHHQGVLCVIEQCEVGHIETLLEGDTLEAWFVGGGHDTDRSVRVKAREIPLKVRLPGKGEKTLVLKSAPMRLAGEKVGDASHFIARAAWLEGVKEFQAQGEINFKGVRRKLYIKYPEGYDPDHEHQGREPGHENKEEHKKQ